MEIAEIIKELQRVADENGKRAAKLAPYAFNVFKICGVDRSELMHSAFIANLLNPNGTHGLGSKFLEEFLLTCDVSVPNALESVLVTTEESHGEGRFDIILRNDCDWVLMIENKVDADEGYKQLQRYQQYLRKQKGAWGILFLTPDGRASQTMDAKSTIQVRPISYRKEIKEWIGRCIAIAAEAPLVRETLAQYRWLVASDISGTITPESTISIEDIAEDCYKGEVQLLKQLSQVDHDLYLKVKSRAAHRIANDFWQSIRHEYDFELESHLTAQDPCSKYTRFYLKPTKGLSRGIVAINFEFDEANLEHLNCSLYWVTNPSEEMRSAAGAARFKRNDRYTLAWDWVGSAPEDRNWTDEFIQKYYANEAFRKDVLDILRQSFVEYKSKMDRFEAEYAKQMQHQ